jgi:hypothetical protein
MSAINGFRRYLTGGIFAQVIDTGGTVRLSTDAISALKFHVDLDPYMVQELRKFLAAMEETKAEGTTATTPL